MKNVIRKLFQPRGRKYLYRVASAAVAIAATKGLLSGNEVAALLYLVSAVLGLADANVEVPEKPQDAI